MRVRPGAPPAKQHLLAALSRAPKAACHEEAEDESHPSSGGDQATHHRTRPTSRARRNLRAGRRCGSTELAMAVTLHHRHTWEWVSLNTNTGPRENRCQRPDRSKQAAKSKRRHRPNIPDSACALSTKQQKKSAMPTCRAVKVSNMICVTRSLLTAFQARSGTLSAEPSLPGRPSYIFKLL